MAQTYDLNFDQPKDNDFIQQFSGNTSLLSTEENDSRFPLDYNDILKLYEENIEEMNMVLFSEEKFKDISSDTEETQSSSVFTMFNDELVELLNDNHDIFHAIESNDMSEQIQSGDENLAMIKSTDQPLSVVAPYPEKSPTKTSFSSSIAPTSTPFSPSISLATSIVVSASTPHQLKILCELEDTYRARYKSDYFPQSGPSRRPRYVADKNANHYVSIQMPIEYNRDVSTEYIRAALITTKIDSLGYFYSPYKFQTNHRDAKVPDDNPIYLPVNIDKKDNFMKLQLVLIKSKLDQLYDAQPLKPFPSDVNIQNIINEEKLAPKDLISRYQLDKSHLAFTLCTKQADGSFYIHHETTVISSMITESSAKQPQASKTEPG